MNNALKWFERGAGGMTGLIPGADDALMFTQRGKRILTSRPQLAWGVRNIAGPLAVAAKLIYLDQTVLGGASNRTLDVITRGRYDAGGAWDRSPSARLSRLHTHGWQVKPENRMRRNAPLPYGEDYLRQERARYS